MLKKSLCFILFTLPITNCVAATPVQDMPSGKYELDLGHASIIWKVSHMGLSNYPGHFTDFKADLDFNATYPEKSSLTVSIDPTSIETNYPNPEKEDFNKKLIDGKDWFNSAAHPAITFTSTAIKMTGDKTGEMTGDLTFLGVTKPITLDVTFNGAMEKHPFANKPALGFSATGTLKRSEWDFKTYIPTIGDEVSLAIEAEFFKAD